MSKYKHNDPFTVSDHAVLRYLERVHNIDIDALRRHILTSDRKLAIKAGATAIKIKGSGRKLIIHDNVVVTVK